MFVKIEINISLLVNTKQNIPNLQNIIFLSFLLDYPMFPKISGDMVVSQVSSISSESDTRRLRHYRISLCEPARCEHLSFLYLKNDWTDQTLN